MEYKYSGRDRLSRPLIFFGFLAMILMMAAAAAAAAEDSQSQSLEDFETQEEIPQICPLGPSYFDGCNWCRCGGAKGTIVCSKRACPTFVVVLDADDAAANPKNPNSNQPPRKSDDTDSSSSSGPSSPVRLALPGQGPREERKVTKADDRPLPVTFVKSAKCSIPADDAIFDGCNWCWCNERGETECTREESCEAEAEA